MVFLQFPPNLTDEELMLQNKYAKLRKIKKKLAAVQSGAGKADGDKSGHGISGVHGGVGGSGGSGGGGSGAGGSKKSSVPEAKAAKEVAKKLIRSGAITAIKKSVEMDKKAKFRGFKRSQGLERKLTGMDARAGYQPFSATHGPGGGFDTGGEDMNPEPPEPAPKKVKNLYDSFVSARDREERGLSDRDGGKPPSDKPRQGNTVYVFGYNITEDILRTTLVAVGKIVNISMEVEKNCGFVTFDKAESAEQAILDHNGTVVQGISLKVSMARRQPVIEPINDASSSATWSTIAASHSQKGSHKDKRELVSYGEDVF